MSELTVAGKRDHSINAFFCAMPRSSPPATSQYTSGMSRGSPPLRVARERGYNSPALRRRPLVPNPHIYAALFKMEDAGPGARGLAR